MDPAGLFDVKGKVVLVTGGAKGVGRMISEAFVAAGAKVYISSRDAKACDQAVKDLNALEKGSAQAIPADFYELSECRRLASELARRETRLDILVNNSGSNWAAPYSDFPDSAWTRVLTLNLQRVFTITQLLTPLLENASKPLDPARVINIGSVDGIRIPPLETFSYSASKAGLHHMSKVLASHSGSKGEGGITFNTLALGPFESKMMKKTLDDFGEAIRSGIPLGRIGTPEDVGGACIFLASRAGAFVNGATIVVDGGSLVSSKL